MKRLSDMPQVRPDLLKIGAVSSLFPYKLLQQNQRGNRLFLVSEP
jgi:hypothetical protein